MPVEETWKQMDACLLRAVIREKVHHTVELPLNRALFGDSEIRRDVGVQARKMLAAGKERGLTSDLPDIQWAEGLLTIVDRVLQGERPALEAPFPRPLSPQEFQVVHKLIRTRRSIRWWKPAEVDRELLLRVIEAGLWAPHACNLQTLRVILMQDAESHALFKMKEFYGAPVYLVVCQDTRAYQHFAATVPGYNRLLDCGAAVQNMCLMTHALGLGAVWGTFHPKEVEAIRKYYSLPDYIEIVTYLALGWPAENPLAPGRLTPQDVLLAG